MFSMLAVSNVPTADRFRTRIGDFSCSVAQGKGRLASSNGEIGGDLLCVNFPAFVATWIQVGYVFKWWLDGPRHKYSVFLAGRDVKSHPLFKCLARRILPILTWLKAWWGMRGRFIAFWFRRGRINLVCRLPFLVKRLLIIRLYLCVQQTYPSCRIL